jgi:hypothetical protein
VRVTTRTGRFGLALAVLLVLFGVSAAAAGEHRTSQHQVTATSGSASSASSGPSVYDDLRDWLRLSAGTLRAPATALPDTTWAVCPCATGGYARRGQSRVGEGSRTATAIATLTPRSSRAPPIG